MPDVTFDGQSFSIDGRRVWLVSGAIHYPRVPRELWRDRIRAAKQAGLNCIETYVFWNAHEAQPGRFDFTGNLDLRAFVEMIGQEGMFAIVRPGPFICAEWDFGGLPVWLHREARDPKTGQLLLRQSSAPFLEACSRYYRAVMEQIADLQVTSKREGKRTPTAPGNPAGEAACGFHAGWRSVCGGPIIMMQAENEWFCHNDDQAQSYLNELVRYLRENGCQTPIIMCNQLWQQLDGTIQTWNASAHLATDLRQLAAVQPNAPRLISEYWPGWFDQWGGKHADSVDAGKHLYRLASILGAGAQYNMFMFHGGTNFGFWGGRTVASKDCFMTTSYDYDAPLLEAGGRGDKYNLTKRISTFASHFAGVFASLEARPQHVTVQPSENDHPLSIIHQKGSQGDVVFFLRAEKDKTTHTELMLPNGLKLPIHLGKDRAAWVLLNTNLSGVATLDFTNLRPFAFVDRRMLVLFGPAGSEGVISLDETELHITVPRGKEPAVERFGDLTLVVLSDEQVDAAYLTPKGLAVGCDKLDEHGDPTPRKGWPRITLVNLDGATTVNPAKPSTAPRAPKLTGWRSTGVDALIDADPDAFDPIDGPASLEQLGCDYGYGWYRIALHKGAMTGKDKFLCPNAGDRLHIYEKGKLKAVLGPGASTPSQPAAGDEPLALKLEGDIVVLADNLGRFNYGQHLGCDLKGIPHHLMQVKPVRLRKPEIRDELSPDPFALSGYVQFQRKGEHAQSQSFTWQVTPQQRKPVILDIQGLAYPGVIFINDQPFTIYNAGAHASFLRLVLDPADNGPFTGGKNAIKLALFKKPDKPADVVKHITVYQVTNIVTTRATWGFKKWSVPGDAAFEAAAPAKNGSRPQWHRATFNVSSADTPLFLEPRGLSKGQLYLNGHNIGRYVYTDEKGKPRGPQKLYYLPEPWLKTDSPNALTVFDEHGHPPTKARLLYRPLGPYH